MNLQKCSNKYSKARISKNFYKLKIIFSKAQEFDGIKIIRYEESLYYANVENFKYQIFKLSGVNPGEISSLIKIEEQKEKKIVRK